MRNACQDVSWHAVLIFINSSRPSHSHAPTWNRQLKASTWCWACKRPHMKGSTTCRSCCSVLLACCCTPCCAVRCAAPVLSAERLTDLDASARIHGGSSLIAASSAAADTVCCPAGAGRKDLYDIPRLQVLGSFDVVYRIKAISLRTCSASKRMALQGSHISEDYASGK